MRRKKQFGCVALMKLACEPYEIEKSWKIARELSFCWCHSLHSLTSSPMSILVNSVRTSQVEISATTSQTVLSSWFLSFLPPSEAFTFATSGPHGSFNVVLPCTISPLLASDVCLGLDWTSHVREWWARLGLTGDFIAADHIHAHEASGVSLTYSPFHS